MVSGSHEIAPSHSRPFHELVRFTVAFFLCWSASVLLVWKLGLLPEAARPWYRTAVWVGAASLWVWWQRPPRPLAWLGLDRPSKTAALTAVGAFVGILAWNAFRVQITGSPTSQLANWPAGRWVWSLVGVFVEELVFRGVIQTRLHEHWSAPLAITAAASLFLLIHLPGWIILSIPITGGIVISVLLLGALCGALRWWSSSLWPAVAAHWANNLGAAL
jgi:membrane protease YdiL (CAAX protease family)